MSERTWLLVASGTLVATLVFLGVVLYLGNEESKVGVEFEPTMDAVEEDIDEFWGSLLSDLGYGDSYNNPDDVVYFNPSEPVTTACGPTMPNLAFFCGGDNKIYLDRALLEQLFNDSGPYAPTFILAHEWGHSVQQSLGILQMPSFTIQIALQADCFAGMYARDLDERDLIDDEELRGTITALILGGDPAIVPWWAPAAQGSPQERVSAFTAGYDEGWLACTSEPFIGPQVQRDSE